jgi:two-component system, sensor histidine kinase and response regulator
MVNTVSTAMLSLSPSDTISKTTAPVETSRKRTLLIVDDEEGPRQSLRIVFKEEYNLLLAENGAKAIELAKLHPIDAAVLDIRMSGMSGIDLLNHLKRVDPAIEVIMLTAYETIETARQALRLGACDYLNKPFDISTMRAAVSKAMERRTLSNQIKGNNEKLQELQRELQNEKLQAEMTRTRGEIYGSIIHDINGPLTVISGLIDIINQRIAHANCVEGDDLELVKDRLARITRQVTNCIEISRRYLSFLREKSAPTTKVSVNQLLTDLWELLKFHTSLKENDLAIKPFPKELLIEANGTDVIQILLNLTINALQCTPVPHHVEIRGQELTQPVDLTAIPDGLDDHVINREDFSNTVPLVMLSVQDNGPGIPADIIHKIFDPYFTTKVEARGTGLGLAIVQRLIKEAKGALHLHTERNRGATFTLYLPAREIS